MASLDLDHQLSPAPIWTRVSALVEKLVRALVAATKKAETLDQALIDNDIEWHKKPLPWKAELARSFVPIFRQVAVILKVDAPILTAGEGKLLCSSCRGTWAVSEHEGNGQRCPELRFLARARQRVRSILKRHVGSAEWLVLAQCVAAVAGRVSTVVALLAELHPAVAAAPLAKE